jgi:hypothetical protein
MFEYIRSNLRPCNIDDPVIGGRVTICTLLFGDFPKLHENFLKHLLATTNPDWVSIHVGTNSLAPAASEWLTTLRDRGDIQYLDMSADNRKKYPVMRHLFHESGVETKWMVWLDDDTICDKDPAWLEKMCWQAIGGYKARTRAVAPVARYKMTRRWTEWCQAATWWKDRPWHKPHPTNRLYALFPLGSFWMIHTQTARDLDIPDPRIGHNKGDVSIGCQLWQSNYDIAVFDSRRTIVSWNNSARRGLTDKHQAES